MGSMNSQLTNSIKSSRRINTSPETRDQIRQSYAFALKCCGQDKDSGSIWWDYIQFMKSGQVRIPLCILAILCLLSVF